MGRTLGRFQLALALLVIAANAGCEDEVVQPTKQARPISTEIEPTPILPDAQTRARIEAHRAELKAAIESMTKRDTSGLRVERKADGSTMLHLGDHFRTISVATTDESGAVKVECAGHEILAPRKQTLK